MKLQQEPHTIKGMCRDNSISNLNATLAYECNNIRITARDSNTLLSVTNERGTKRMIDSLGNNIEIMGTILGFTVLNEYIVIFSTSPSTDYIYRLNKSQSGDYFESNILYNSIYKLGFSVDYPIQAFGVYENDNIQKVYWTDGLNQPRVINITKAELIGGVNAMETVRMSYTPTSFDFVQELKFNEQFSVTKNTSNGYFATGVIQYAYTYYNKYGQESNIVEVSPLNYISPTTRGGKADEFINNSFTINIQKIDKSFEYVRIYSIHRTSIDSTPLCKIIADIDTSTLTGRVDGSNTYYDIVFTDTGNLGSEIDPTLLLYIGGEEISAKAMTQKDNTLFLGNIEIKRKEVSIYDRTALKNKSEYITTDIKTIQLNNEEEDYYKYDDQLIQNFSTFKSGEYYRLGIQLQYKTGKWSDPIYITDYQVPENQKPIVTISTEVGHEGERTLNLVTLKCSLPAVLANSFIQAGYKRVRGVAVMPSIQDRHILTQGMICPTVFNIKSRATSTPFAQSSWFIRPNSATNITANVNDSNINNGAIAEFRHNKVLINGQRGVELQGINARKSDAATVNKDLALTTNAFYVDQSIITMHSPDIEFDTRLNSMDFSDYKFRIVGLINFTSSIGDIELTTSSTTINKNAPGFTHRTLGIKNRSSLADRSLVAGIFYVDSVVNKDTDTYKALNSKYRGWMIYPWQSSGSLTNDIKRPDGSTTSSVLKRKVISNLKYSAFNTWLPTMWNAEVESPYGSGVTTPQLFNSNEMQLTRIPTPKNSDISNINYYGNVDTVLLGSWEYKKCTGEVSNINDVFEQNISGNYAVESVDASMKDTVISSVRLKYKSTPHLVFSFNYSTTTGSQIILPTVKDSAGNTLNPISSNIKPFWFNSASNIPTSSLLNIKVATGTLPDASYTYMGQYWYYNNSLWLGTEICVPDPNNREGELICTPEWEIVEIDVFKSMILYDSFTNTYYKVTSNSTTENVTLEVYSTGSSDIYYHISQDVLNTRVDYPYLFLGELYKEVNTNTIFGGQSDDAIKNNLWIPVGKAVNLVPNIINTITYEYGDTWYTRYDCLKTYPYTNEDENSVVEIGSFMCESRINMNGRCDRNIGQVSNLNMSPVNFNLLNSIYSQNDNFFNYRVLDSDYYKLNKFVNTVTWTKEKAFNSDIDLWTNITMANTLDLDGNKGDITSINLFNNELFCFQKRGFSNLLFNSRVQIPTSDGIPIEITNGLKMQSKRYISNNVGCENKRSIVETPTGLYFIDNEGQSIYKYTGQLENISDHLGFSTWVKEQCTKGNNFITFYDKNNRDIYFTTEDSCICYSEIIGQFTSFMSYYGINTMFNYQDNLYSLYGTSTGKYLWEHFTGDYNIIYGTYRPYSLTIFSNSNPSLDKTYSTIDCRADMWNNDKLSEYFPFDKLEISNEYQNAESILVNSKNSSSSLKKKFRVWRITVPRDYSNGRDRIRNTWAKITLSSSNADINKMQLHDLVVNYYI